MPLIQVSSYGYTNEKRSITMNPLWALLFAELGERLIPHTGEMPAEPPTEPNTIDAILEARKAMRTVQDFERHLGENVDKLALICRAMWELIRERTNLTEEDLLKKVREIDLLDGALDGKVKNPPKKCSKCNRTMSKRHTRCMYCGTEALLDTAFDSI